MIDGGRIVELGDTDTLFANPQSDILRTLIADEKQENHRAKITSTIASELNNKPENAQTDEQTNALTNEVK